MKALHYPAHPAIVSRVRLLLKNSNRGQTMIEILIATGVIAMVMTAVVSGLTLSVKNTSQSKYRALASKQAQEGIEVYRRERSNLGWESFYATVQNGDYCLGQTLPADTTAFVSLQSGQCSTGYQLGGTTYYREVNISKTPPDTVSVTVTSSWEDGSQTRSTSITQDLRPY